MWVYYENNDPINLAKCLTIKSTMSEGAYIITFVMEFTFQVVWYFGRGDERRKYRDITFRKILEIIKSKSIMEI